MINVLFFARYREELGTRQLQVDLPAGSSVADLVAQLVDHGGDNWGSVLHGQNTVIAVNQVVSNLQQPLQDNDEVAFYPPVTGG
jgi:molybdopterin synthase sulfur carrier subunit